MYYQTNGCTAGGSNNICEGGTALACDLGANGEDVDAHMWAVSDASAGDVVAWGQDGAGDVFCCDLTVSGENLTCGIDGTVHDDVVKLQFDDSTAGPLDLGITCVVHGYEEDDELIGSRTVSDQMYGDSGSDTIRGYGGSDHLYGGDHTDYVFGGAGVDYMEGNAYADTMDGGDESDLLYGGDGDDTLRGGDGDDIVYGEGQADTVYGEAGDDTLYGGGGDDRILSNEGDDLVYGGDGDDVICSGVDDDEAYGENGYDMIFDVSGTDTVDGGPNVDQCDNAGHETLAGCENLISACPP